MPFVPNSPGTPIRAVRVPDPLWDASEAKAVDEHGDVSKAIRWLLENWVRGAFDEVWLVDHRPGDDVIRAAIHTLADSTGEPASEIVRRLLRAGLDLPPS